jgi:hypothetical protein
MKKLQRACLRIKAATASGKPIQKTIRRVAHSLNGRPFRCDPTRKLALSPMTLRRLWDAWRRGGEVPAVFRLNYGTPTRRVSATVLVRFVNFAMAHDELSTFAAAWRAFCRRKGNAGPGLFRGNPLVLGYDTLQRNLPRGFFAGVRRNRKAIRTAQRELSRARISALAYIITRVPAKLPKPTDFQI